MKKYFSIIMFVILVSLFSVSAFAATAIEARLSDQSTTLEIQGEVILRQLLARQFKSLSTGEDVDTSDIFTESANTSQYNMFLEWRIAEAIAMETIWKDYSFDLKIISISADRSTVDINAIVDLSYTLAINDASCGQWGYAFSIKAIDTPNGLRISEITSEESMYTDFCANILNPVEVAANESLARRTLDETISDLDVLAYEMSNIVFSDPVPENIITKNVSDTLNITRALKSYTYNASTGISYANTYHTTYNSCFKSISGLDCTNFVSQCIWAAYGGWSSGDSVATMTTNISNRKRMMDSSKLTNWFGHNNGHGTPWESVTGLWNFATGNPSEGPKANGYNNNSLYTGISPSSIGLANVLQLWSSSESVYRHSLYVVEKVVPVPTSYTNIIVAAHTSNGRFNLSDKIASWGGSSCKMRRLEFVSAYFNQ